MRKILVFTGAGFCVPLKLPMTTGFQNEIDNINKDLKPYVQQYLSDKINDIEKVLELLEDFGDEKKFDSYILNYKYKNSETHKNVIFDYNKLKRHSNDAANSIKKSIYKTLNNFELNDSIKLYSFLLHEIKTTFPNCSISFFTTNYDLTFEKAIDHSPEVVTSIGINDVNFGFTSKLGTTRFDRNKIYSWESDQMEYQKLHGSLDWVKDHFGQCTKSGASVIPAEPSNTPILYPGYKGVPIIDPFISMHDNLLRKANEAEIILCIGFAFRDPYINNIFDSTLRFNKELRVLCYNPAEPDVLPKESKIHDFIREFPNFRYIKKGISINNTPLNLSEEIPPNPFESPKNVIR